MTTPTTNFNAVKLLKKFHKIDPATNYEPGDLFQVNASHDPDGSRRGWVGAIVITTEVNHSGIIGYIHQIHDHKTRGKIWIRFDWSEVDFVGEARQFDTSDDFERP